MFGGCWNRGSLHESWLRVRQMRTKQVIPFTRRAATGRKGGRKSTVTPDKLARARLLIAGELTVREAPARLKVVGKSTLYNALGTSADSIEGSVLSPFA